MKFLKNISIGKAWTFVLLWPFVSITLQHLILIKLGYADYVYDGIPYELGSIVFFLIALFPGFLILWFSQGTQLLLIAVYVCLVILYVLLGSVWLIYLNVEILGLGK